MGDKVKIAAIQMEPKIMQNRLNLDNMLLNARNAAHAGADLIVFPECALTGYVFTSRKEAVSYMETIPGPSTNELIVLCRELGVYIVAGLIETDGDKCFNSAVFVGPEGLIGKYRKNHLPSLGIDRFLDRGNKPFAVYKTAIGNIGLHICYDCAFPESARIMTLLGADILALPTNWPEGLEKVAEHVVVTRAFENRVHLVAADRVGSERGTRFIGLSKIINAWGDTLAEADGENEQIICGEVSLSDPTQKRAVFLRDRRPELYGEFTKRPQILSRS